MARASAKIIGSRRGSASCVSHVLQLTQRLSLRAKPFLRAAYDLPGPNSAGVNAHASLNYVRNCWLRRPVGSSAHSCSMVCAGWNIAATIPPGSRSLTATTIETRKCAGRIARSRANSWPKSPPAGRYGISHTRWATHGKVTDENAHPHFDASGKLALVHNGVIENYQALKDQLIQDGDTNFQTETDTEVLAHLIGNIYDAAQRRTDSQRRAWSTRCATRSKQVIGTYGIAAGSRRHSAISSSARGAAARSFSALAKTKIFSPAMSARSSPTLATPFI